jgi:hypothetical protein
MCTKFWSETLKRIYLLKDIAVDRKIILKYIYRQGGCGLDSSNLEYGPLACPCEYDNESSCSIKEW